MQSDKDEGFSFSKETALAEIKVVLSYLYSEKTN